MYVYGVQWSVKVSAPKETIQRILEFINLHVYCDSAFESENQIREKQKKKKNDQ